MSRDMSWVDAAMIILSDSPNFWMTAPEIVREIQRRDVRSINNYGQSVRTLRSALNINSKKSTHSMFLRSEGDSSVAFALRERLDSVPDPPKPDLAMKRKRISAKECNHYRRQQQKEQRYAPVANGLPRPRQTPAPRQQSNPCPRNPPSQFPASVPVSKNPSTASVSTTKSAIQSPPPSVTTPTTPSTATALTTPPAVLFLARPQPILTVEIDPALKPARARLASCDSDVSSHLCLPSPLSSILGPRRTLQVLNECIIPPSLRPVRQVRKRKSSAREVMEEAPLSPPVVNGCSLEAPLLPSLPRVLQVDVNHSLPSYLSDVVCMSSSYALRTTNDATTFEDPCHAQGKRSHSATFEFGPKYPRTKRAKSSFHGSESLGSTSASQVSSSSSSESESDLSDDDDDDYQFQPRPSSRLLMGQRRLSRQQQQRQRRASMDYSQLTESVGEDGDVSSEAESVDVDVEFVGPTAQQAAAASYYPPRASRVGQGGAKKRQAGAKVGEKGEKRNIGVLFQPQSPLVMENMKSLLNTSAFMGLTEAQRARLMKLLPAVDRVGPSAIRSDSLNNSFYSSALREWVEQVAVGAFTPEYRAKVRAEEKKKAAAKADNSWKARFFEENWGNRIAEPSDHTPNTTPYYPHNSLTPRAAQCLQTILNAYPGKDIAPRPSMPSTQPEATPPSISTAAQPPPATPPASHTPSSPPATPTKHSSVANSPKVQSKPLKPQLSPRVSVSVKKVVSPKKPAPVKPTVQVQKRNHVVKKLAQKSAILLSQGKSSKSVSRKNTGVTTVGKNSLDKMRVIKQLKLNSQNAARVPAAQFLTCLPPRTPYQTLLQALAQACEGNKDTPSAPPPQHHDHTPSTTTTTTTHTHSVYHDHFALLNSSHVPSEFSLPITSLSLQLPLDAYTSCMCARVAKAEHSYAKAPESTPVGGEFELSKQEHKVAENLNLKLSLPRELLQANDVCGCDRGALVVCSQCKCLYHNVCAQSTLCPTCVTIQSLNLSN